MQRHSRPWTKKIAVRVSILLITACLALNKVFLDLVLGLDLLLSLPLKLALVVGFQALGIGPSLWILLRRPAGLFPVATFRFAALAVAGCLLFGIYGSARVLGVFDPHREYRSIWKEVVESEELILSLDPHMERLNFSVSNLALPDFQSQLVFADDVQWNDLGDEPATPRLVHQQSSVVVEARQWAVTADLVAEPRAKLSIWRRLFNEVDYFEHAKFAVMRGRFLNDRHTEFETDLQFNGTARMKSGVWNALSATLKAGWRRAAEDDWRIFRWTLEGFATLENERLAFVDALDEVLPDAEDLRRARTSIHEQLVIESLETGQGPGKYFEREAWDQHPGISVVDLDADGFDDFYVMERWGKNLFFHNNGDGTFREKAAALGLDIEGQTSSALFADFDNDGDKDVFLGRTLARSMFLENVGHRFVDRSQNVTDAPLPYLVSSVSATDYDGDGLLDVYFSTYAAHLLDRNRDGIAEFLAPDDFEHLSKLLASPEMNKFADLPGPPNVLLRNLGNGRFTDTSKSTGLNVFRNTYQSTWADYDGDGDQDVYLANDFSGNNLLRNDGMGRFVDVSEETRTTDVGFGMGASWGDYDNDGRQDLYVSNMYSKAGRRITAQFDYLDTRFAQMARGNSLFRSLGDGFEKVSGLEPPAMLVEKAGWSWGSQYVDVDNDGYLDIYALSGYYTSPRDNGLPDL